MKKKVLFAIASVIVMLSGLRAYALGNELLDIRGSFFQEYKALKPLLTESKDVILLSSMQDSCIVTMTQLDAYFSMIGIYNAIKKEDLSEQPLNFLISWLSMMKNTTDLNTKSLIATPRTIAPRTKIHKDKLLNYFGDLNVRLANELNKLSLLKEALKRK